LCKFARSRRLEIRDDVGPCFQKTRRNYHATAPLSDAATRQRLTRHSPLRAMFVPRALRLKGVKEHPRPKPSKPPPTARPEVRKDDALVDAMEGISTDSPASQPEHIDPGVVTRGPRFTIKQITPQYIAQLAVGIDLIFSDYAHQEEGRSKWLEQRYRTLDREERCM
jgi:hypothetical protein